MFSSGWDLAVLLTRAGIYAAVAGAVGGLFALLVFRRSSAAGLWAYLRWSCVLGLGFSGLEVLFRTAAMVGDGAAMFDSTFLSIIARSSIGESAGARAIGFLLLLAGSFCLRISRTAVRRAAVLTLLLGAVVLPWSFTVAGHTVDQSWPTRLALALHVLAMSLWIGSFYPLLHLLRDATAAANLKLFGDLAVGIVGLLMTCGIWVGLVLLERNVSGMLSHSYGQLLTAKLVMVGILLLLAASNKWFWVPQLAESGNPPRGQSALKRSIQSEWVVGIVVFCITGALATLAAV
ncbi:copper resistance D family protein [Gilvimarinus sp. F26214L]|uniref:copper resistance D family protein n=1 Tax=Gilvimarinus sp. DZF01 TaxID=3461371 RepID=UPI004045FAA3